MKAYLLKQLYWRLLLRKSTKQLCGWFNSLRRLRKYSILQCKQSNTSSQPTQRRSQSINTSKHLIAEHCNRKIISTYNFIYSLISVRHKSIYCDVIFIVINNYQALHLNSASQCKHLHRLASRLISDNWIVASPNYIHQPTDRPTNKATTYLIASTTLALQRVDWTLNALLGHFVPFQADRYWTAEFPVNASQTRVYTCRYCGGRLSIPSSLPSLIIIIVKLLVITTLPR